MESSKKKELITTLAVLLAIVVIVGIVVVTTRKSEDTSSSVSTAQTGSSIAPASDTQAQSTVEPAESTASSLDTSTVSMYKDGTYTATGTYSTPEGQEDITVTLTLEKDVVTDTSATASMDSRESKEYTEKFLENFKAAVVSKSIDDLKLSRVSGSSLTSQGFNSAVEKIKSQAKS